LIITITTTEPCTSAETGAPRAPGGGSGEQAHGLVDARVQHFQPPQVLPLHGARRPACGAWPCCSPQCQAGLGAGWHLNQCVHRKQSTGSLAWMRQCQGASEARHRGARAREQGPGSKDQ